MVGQFRPAVPSHITCFTCGERGHYATSYPRTHTVQPVVPGVPPVGHVNPPLTLPPAKRQATAGRAYTLELPGPSGPPKGPISDTRLPINPNHISRELIADFNIKTESG
ncbi:hypothetical protein N665_0142s0008 [Sinapis alba]|nr:hypothetical protein N665_0142s0008 [Sinapis alba]